MKKKYNLLVEHRYITKLLNYINLCNKIYANLV